jgi:hypothetical protein
MKPSSKKLGKLTINKGGAVLRVNIPSFKFDRAH